MNKVVMEEDKLIFIISQPRSGSSMLQQLLLQSEKIDSKPEPWLMLPLIYIYKRNEFNCGYNNAYSQINLLNYINDNNYDIADLKRKIKELALDIYAVGRSDNHSFFLDKTPRYYHIAEDLVDLFPKANFIFLSRNPLAVFQSILHYNFYGDIDHMISKDRIHDIFDAIKNIAEIKRKEFKNCYFVNYENLVHDTTSSLKDIFNFLKLNYPQNIGEYHVNKDFQNTNATDLKSLFKHSKPDAQYLDAWKETIRTSEDYGILKEYINLLNKDDLTLLGYDNLGDQIKGIKVKYKLIKYRLRSLLHKETSLRYKVIYKLKQYSNI